MSAEGRKEVKSGAFTFVLHSHLPYVRKAGRWPHGEEMVHEAIAETYIPLVNALFDLKEAGYNPRLTIGITPILMEQLADPDVLQHFELYVEERLTLVDADRRYWEGRDEHRTALAQFYLNFYGSILHSFRERYGRDLLGAFRRLQDEGNLDVITSAATHAYLPLMERDSTIYGQIKTGVDTYVRHMGRKPKGIWLPECGYRPGYMKEGNPSYYKPGFEEFLAHFDLGYFFTDTHVIQGGQLVGKVAGDVVGPYGAVPMRKVVVKPDTRPEATLRTTFRPYYVQAADVAVFGRDERTGMQVWSAAYGYPGDFVYREFHRKDSNSGAQYWRITGTGVDLGHKDLYYPEPAQRQVQVHADHFVHLVVERLLGWASEHDEMGIIVSAYDSELFGHWWFEGVDWLKEVLRQLSVNPDVELTTARDYLDAHPPTEVMALPESSWGAGGGHWTWENPDTEWMWPLIRTAERRMEKIAARWPHTDVAWAPVLAQVARELVLLESSDWPFLISTGQAREYAEGRFQQHLARFNHLAAVAERGEAVSDGDRRFLDTAAELDNPFPQIQYEDFADREGRLE
jgi:1,4-alpha-glucan branching enzyme